MRVVVGVGFVGRGGGGGGGGVRGAVVGRAGAREPQGLAPPARGGSRAEGAEEGGGGALLELGGAGLERSGGDVRGEAGEGFGGGDLGEAVGVCAAEGVEAFDLREAAADGRAVEEGQDVGEGDAEGAGEGEGVLVGGEDEFEGGVGVLVGFRRLGLGIVGGVEIVDRRGGVVRLFGGGGRCFDGGLHVPSRSARCVGRLRERTARFRGGKGGVRGMWRSVEGCAHKAGSARKILGERRGRQASGA